MSKVSSIQPDYVAKTVQVFKGLGKIVTVYAYNKASRVLKYFRVYMDPAGERKESEGRLKDIGYRVEPERFLEVMTSLSKSGELTYIGLTRSAV